VLISSALRVVDLHIRLRLNLAHEIKLLKLSHINMVVSMLILMHDAQEIIFVSFMIENRAVIHVVFQDCNSIPFTVDLPKQRYLFASFLHNLHAIGTHVPQVFVLRSSCESSLWERLIRIHIPLKLASHAKIIHEKRSLIDMLEKAEFSIF